MITDLRASESQGDLSTLVDEKLSASPGATSPGSSLRSPDRSPAAAANFDAATAAAVRVQVSGTARVAPPLPAEKVKPRLPATSRDVDFLAREVGRDESAAAFLIDEFWGVLRDRHVEGMFIASEYLKSKGTLFLHVLVALICATGSAGALGSVARFQESAPVGSVVIMACVVMSVLSVLVGAVVTVAQVREERRLWMMGNRRRDPSRFAAARELPDLVDAVLTPHHPTRPRSNSGVFSVGSPNTDADASLSDEPGSLEPMGVTVADYTSVYYLEVWRSLAFTVFNCAFVLSIGAWLTMLCPTTREEFDALEHDPGESCELALQGMMAAPMATQILFSVTLSVLLLRLRTKHLLAYVVACIFAGICQVIFFVRGGHPVRGALSLLFFIALSVGIGFTSARSRALQQRLRFKVLLQLVSRVDGHSRAVQAASAAKLLAAQANERRRVSSNTLGFAAHELRNPLHQIRAALVDARAYTGIPELVLDDLTMCEHASEQMLVICNDVLDLAKLMRGKGAFSLFPIATDVFSAMSIVYEQWKRVAGERMGAVGENYTMSVDDGVPRMVVVDSTRLAQLAHNGVSNALKHVGVDGAVSVRVVANKSRTLPPTAECKLDAVPQPDLFLRIDVRNRGRGLGGLDAAKLLEPFSQSANSLVSTRFRGAGLGLPICRMLTNFMGGSVTLCDETVDGVTWTVFSVEVPVTVASSEGTGAQVDPRTAAVAELTLPRPLHVAVVDDERINRRVLHRMLRRLGCTVEEYSDGDELDVERCATEKPFDVFLLDIVMIRVGGDVLATRLRSAGVTVPLVATTGNSHAQDIRRYRRAGFSDVLTKPFDVQQLVEVLTRLCGEDNGGGGAGSAAAEASEESKGGDDDGAEVDGPPTF